MTLTIKPTSLTDILIIEPKVWGDERGFFLESFNERDFCNSSGLNVRFVQDNHSFSKKGVLRGLHYQIKHPQGKLVRVTRGQVYDVAVNIQRGHPEFGQWVGTVLSETNHRQLWIPSGFAHGFVILSDWADFQYKTTDYFDATYERIIRWNDPELNIEWPIDFQPTMSHKDCHAPLLRDAELFD